MSQYNVLQAIIMSFYSKKLYRDVAMNWGGKAFLYLLLLVALSWILFTIQVQFTLNKIYEKDSEKLIPQIPVMTIKDGKLSTPENRPYVITDPENHENLVVIDTSGTYTTLEQAHSNFLITQTEMITRSKPTETKTNQIPPTLNMVIDPSVVNEFVKKFLGFAWIILFVVFTISAYIYRIIQALLYAIIGKLFAVVVQIPLSYDKILQVAMVAVTPAIVLSTIFDFFNISFAYQELFYFILSVLYLFYGVSANKNRPETIVTTDSKNDKWIDGQR